MNSHQFASVLVVALNVSTIVTLRLLVRCLSPTSRVKDPLARDPVNDLLWPKRVCDRGQPVQGRILRRTLM